MQTKKINIYFRIDTNKGIKKIRAKTGATKNIRITPNGGEHSMTNRELTP